MYAPAEKGTIVLPISKRGTLKSLASLSLTRQPWRGAPHLCVLPPCCLSRRRSVCPLAPGCGQEADCSSVCVSLSLGDGARPWLETGQSLSLPSRTTGNSWVWRSPPFEKFPNLMAKETQAS